MGGHPASLAASLNWTIRRIGDEGTEEVDRSSMSGAWMLVGSSPGIVRRVGDAIQRSEAAGLEQPICMQGVASPARLGLQFADLASLRADGGDQDAPADAQVLERVRQHEGAEHRDVGGGRLLAPALRPGEQRRIGRREAMPHLLDRLDCSRARAEPQQLAG